MSQKGSSRKSDFVRRIFDQIFPDQETSRDNPMFQALAEELEDSAGAVVIFPDEADTHLLKSATQLVTAEATTTIKTVYEGLALITQKAILKVTERAAEAVEEVANYAKSQTDDARDEMSDKLDRLGQIERSLRTTATTLDRLRHEREVNILSVLAGTTGVYKDNEGVEYKAVRVESAGVLKDNEGVEYKAVRVDEMTGASLSLGDLGKVETRGDTRHPEAEETERMDGEGCGSKPVAPWSDGNGERVAPRETAS